MTTSPSVPAAASAPQASSHPQAPGPRPASSASTIKESWIPMSAANVAQTDKPEIPAGFRQIPPSSAFN
jgi:hypothetical protein